MPTTQRRIKRCWAGTAPRRRDFLHPRHYEHRQGASAKMILARVARRLETLFSYHDDGNIFASFVSEPEVPRRPEDLLSVVVSEQGLSLARRGVQLTTLSSLYNVPTHEMARALAALHSALMEVRESSPHHVRLSAALQAVEIARQRIEERPL